MDKKYCKHDFLKIMTKIWTVQGNIDGLKICLEQNKDLTILKNEHVDTMLEVMSKHLKEAELLFKEMK